MQFNTIILLLLLLSGQSRRQGDIPPKRKKRKRTPAEAAKAAGKLNSKRKRQLVVRAVDAMRARGERITISAVAREADVSRTLIYERPELECYVRNPAPTASDRMRALGQLDSEDEPDWLDDWDNDDEFEVILLPFGQHLLDEEDGKC